MIKVVGSNVSSGTDSRPRIKEQLNSKGRNIMIQRRHKRHFLIGLVLVAALLLTQIVVAPIALAAEYDLDAPGDTHTVTGSVGGDAIFEFFNPGDPTGSGVFDPFVRINTNKKIEKGYNTSYRKLQYDENSSPQYTKDYPVANVPVIQYPEGTGPYYYEFQCDVNQKNAAAPAFYLSLDKLEIYGTDTPMIHDYPFNAPTVDAAIVWQMKADDWVRVNSLPNSGSGRRDFRVLIPYHLLDNYKYVVLYSQFGGNGGYVNNGGYEEWGCRVGVEPPPGVPGIDIMKYVSIDDQATWLDANYATHSEYVKVPRSTDIYFKIVVTNTGDVELTGIQVADVWENEGVSFTIIDLSLYGTIPSVLAAGDSFEIIVGPLTAGYCYHTNTAAVSGVYSDQTLWDSDVAKYHGT
jgi:hypothetical protein